MLSFPKRVRNHTLSGQILKGSELPTIVSTLSEFSTKDPMAVLFEAISTKMPNINITNSSIVISQSGKNCCLYDPDTIVTPYPSIKGYLASLEHKYLQSIAEAVKCTSAMHKQCKLTFCIPLAAHQESANIYKALKGLARQSANKAEFEILVFANHPTKDDTGKTIHADNSLTWINQFKREHPNIQVTYAYGTFENDTLGISDIRAFVTDLALQRYINRGNLNRDHLIVSSDADSEGHASEYVETVIARFEANPSLDLQLGQLKWSASDVIRNPFLLWNAHIDKICNSLHYKESGFSLHPGCNSIFRASTYGIVTGYDIAEDCAEDIILRDKISRFRLGSDQVHVLAGDESTTVYTSARRAALAVNAGYAIEQQWQIPKFQFKLDDKIVRFLMAKSMTSSVEFNSRLAEVDFCYSLENILSHAIQHKRELSIPISEKTIAESLKALGSLFRCQIESNCGDFKIKLPENYKDIFMNLRGEYVSRWQAKTKIGTSS